MSKDFGAMIGDVKAAAGHARKQLRSLGHVSHDIAAGLIMEALIEMYGLDYGEQILTTVTQRVIGYSEEMMGLCVVESLRNTLSYQDFTHLQASFERHRQNRVLAKRDVIDSAARAITERQGPFPTTTILSTIPAGTI